jgi:hypothetical protein
MVRAGFATILLITCAANAHADGAITRIITKPDQAKLEKYEATRRTAIDAARKGGSVDDVKQLEEILAKPNLEFSEDFDMAGDWKCRTAKLGKEPALVLYAWFKCRVTDDGQDGCWKRRVVHNARRDVFIPRATNA